MVAVRVVRMGGWEVGEIGAGKETLLVDINKHLHVYIHGIYVHMKHNRFLFLE